MHSRRCKVFSLKSLGPFAKFANRQSHFSYNQICYICLCFQPPWPQVWFPRRARPSLCVCSQTSLCTWDHQSPNTLCVRVQIPFWSRKLVHKYKAPQTQSELFTLIQIICIGSGIQRICCVPNSIYIRSDRSLSSMKVHQCNTGHLKSSHRTNTVEMHGLTNTVEIQCLASGLTAMPWENGRKYSLFTK